MVQTTRGHMKGEHFFEMKLSDWLWKWAHKIEAGMEKLNANFSFLVVFSF